MSPDAEFLCQLEAVIFASTAPVTIARLRQALAGEPSPVQIRQALAVLADQQQGRAIELVETAQGWRFQVRAAYQPVISRALPDRAIRLSPALLEILAVIAYHQPVTRADIEQLRGVSNNPTALRTLFEWHWIREAGHREVPGRPALLVTTPQFLDAFGLTDLAQLPPLPQPDAVPSIDLIPVTEQPS